ADIAIASRALPESRIVTHQHVLRETMGKTFNLMVRALAPVDFHDTQCGFKLFSRRAVDALFPEATVDRFAFDVELLLLAGGLFSSRYDWRYFESMGEISRRCVLWYHEAPLWNPYSCGGEVGLANPQSLDVAPTFLLLLLFGTALGYKLALTCYYFCALDGTY